MDSSVRISNSDGLDFLIRHIYLLIKVKGRGQQWKWNEAIAIGQFEILKG